MYLKSLYLHNFRLYSEAYFEFSPHINIIHGDNGTGKTSLLEAISFLGQGYSFRTHHTAHLIRHGQPHFYLEANFVKWGIEHQLRICYGAREKKFMLNNTRYPSASSLYGSLLHVVLAPDDLELITGAPQGRRHFVDRHLCQINPLYLHHLLRYNRAMRQRNCLLKAKNLLSIESWEHEMAQSASYLQQQRISLLNDIQVYAKNLYSHISHREELLTLRLKCAGLPSDAAAFFTFYLTQLRKNRSRELLLATTLQGPHRDDIDISIGNKDVRSFASEGEKRSVAAALRLAEWQQLQHSSDEKPLMLIDEVSATLDQKRYNRLLGEMESLSQVFVTAADRPVFTFAGKETKAILCA